MLTCQRDFMEPQPYKNTVEKMLYTAAKMVSSVDGVVGPDMLRHIINYRTYVAFSNLAKIRIIERDDDVFEQQLNWKAQEDSIKGEATWMIRTESDDLIWGDVVGTKHLKEDVALVRADITDIQDPARFFDADLMGSALGSSGNAINTILGRQAKLYSSDEARELKKALVFTFSLRGTDEAVTLEWIEHLISSNLNSIVSLGGKSLYTKGRAAGINNVNGWKGTGIHIYDRGFIKRGRVEELKVFYYNETGHPMLSGIVVYR